MPLKPGQTPQSSSSALSTYHFHHPHTSATLSLEHILHHRMCDASNVLIDTFHATSGRDDPPHDTLRPRTPLPDRSRTLQRTVSYASIDTVRAPSRKGVRQLISEIADTLKHKSTMKKNEHLSTHDVPKSAAHDRASDSKAPPASKATKRERKATVPLRDLSHRSGEESVLAMADKLHSGSPSEQDSPLTFLVCKSDPMVDNPVAKEKGKLWEASGFPTRSLNLGAGITQDILQSPRTSQAGIKDVQLNIWPSEPDVTIWDGLRAAHHLFRCRLYLRCTTHSYDSVSLPDINRIEMNCNTHPVGSWYARPPIFQTAYTGASLSWVISSSGLPNVNLAAGIHLDRCWRTIMDDGGTWGWYRDALVPLSPRLFDKMDYREFKLVSRVWVGESCVEDGLTFGISMLLREVDMK